jgi:hypothetical protein
MCVVDLPVAPVPLWQLLQLVADVKVVWSTLAPVHVVVERWQVSQTVCPTWIVVLGLMALWQVAHCAVMVTFWCNRAGVQALNPALWQVSQLAAADAATSW